MRLTICRGLALAWLVSVPAASVACASLAGLSAQPGGDASSDGGAADGDTAADGAGTDGAADASPDTSADSSCGDLRTDPRNCGACGHACGNTVACIDGVCGNTVVKLATGPDAYHTCAVLKDGRLYCWGQNNHGQLGNGDVQRVNRPTATLVGKDIDGNPFDHVVDVTAGAEHTCAQKADKTVFCWGSQAYGETGQAIAGEQLTPNRVLSLSGFLVVRAGGHRTCGIDGSNHVWCWGDNQHLGLGHALGTSGDYDCTNGGTTSKCNNQPVTVSGVNGATMLAMGGDHTCVAGGTVMCWGGNAHSELGAAGPDNASANAVPGVALASALYAGGYLTCAQQQATARCWGFNGNGELGVGDNASPKLSTPWGGAAAPAIAAMAPGGETACALLTSGGVQCAGWNNEGECGSGVFGGPNFNGFENWTPVAVAAAADAGGLLGGVAQLVSGQGHSCALTKDGRVLCWGMNVYGQVGSGSPNNAAAPMAVVGLP